MVRSPSPAPLTAITMKPFENLKGNRLRTAVVAAADAEAVVRRPEALAAAEAVAEAVAAAAEEAAAANQ